MLFMQEELYSEPTVISAAFRANESVVYEIARIFKNRGIKHITLVGRGTSDNACTCFKYVNEILNGIAVSEAHPSVVTAYGGNVNYSDDLVIAVSQSGKSTDTLTITKMAKEQGALTIAITNDESSPLAKLAEYHLHLSAGQEKSVAATKTFACELTVLYMLAVAINGDRELMKTIYSFPDKVSEVLNSLGEIRRLAEKTVKEKNFVILSRGTMQGVGNELALKLGESCYAFAHFYSLSNFMHGPLALIEEGVNVILLAPDGVCKDNFIEIATRLNLLGANLYAFTDIPEVMDIATACVQMNEYDFISCTIAYAMACHLYTLNLSLLKNINPDSPRNLHKVTITK